MLASIIRTVVPLVVGWLAGLPIAQRIGITSTDITAAVTAVTGAVWYVAVRLLETYGPQWGWLLGYAQAPTYGVASADGEHVAP